MSNQPMEITPQMVERALEALHRICDPQVAEGWATSRDVVHCILQAALTPLVAGSSATRPSSDGQPPGPVPP